MDACVRVCPAFLYTGNMHTQTNYKNKQVTMTQQKYNNI